MAETSFSYVGHVQNEPWADDAYLTIPWPEADATGGNVDTANAQIVIGNHIAETNECGIVWNGSPDYTIVIQNTSGADISHPTVVTVCVPSILGQELEPDAHRVHVYTFDTLPSAAIVGRIVYVSDAADGAVLAFSDGTDWRRVTDRAVVTENIA